MAIPLLEYSSTTQNQRVVGYEVPGDDQPRVYSTENLLSATDLDILIAAAYRQIFFHVFAADRERFLESQLRNGQITVRDFIRGLLLSDRYKRSFYDLNSNYRFVEQTVQRVLGRNVYDNREKLAWSIVVATKGIQGFVDELLNSDEYLEAFGYDTIPYQRRRVLPGRSSGEVPFNIQSPRYNKYHLDQLKQLGYFRNNPPLAYRWKWQRPPYTKAYQLISAAVWFIGISCLGMGAIFVVLNYYGVISL